MSTKSMSAFGPTVLRTIRAQLAGRTRRVLPMRESGRRAAVLVPLCHVRGEASILFTLRTSDVGTHKGQVSFPGGHIEEGETPADAAVRELVEEVGDVLHGRVDVLGMSDDVTAITGTIVTPVIGYVEADLDDTDPTGAFAGLELSAGEVEEAFTLSVRHLTNPENVETQMLEHPLRDRAEAIPRYLGGPAPVWGLTAYMLEPLLRDLIVPGIEAHGDSS